MFDFEITTFTDSVVLKLNNGVSYFVDFSSGSYGIVQTFYKRGVTKSTITSSYTVGTSLFGNGQREIRKGW